MLPEWHVLLGIIFALALYPVFGLWAILIFAASILIDFDHYLMYLGMKKDFNIFRAYNYLRKGYLENEFKATKILCVFHTVEFVLLLILLSFLSRIFLFTLVGVSFHLLTDWLHLRIDKRRKIHKSPSIIMYHLGNNKEKKK